MATEKIGFKASLKGFFSNLAVKAYVFFYLIAIAVQLYDNVQNAISSLILSLLCFALILGAIRLTRANKVEAVPVRRPLIGVVVSALMLASWFLIDWGFRTRLIPEITDWELSRFLAQIFIFAVIPMTVLRLSREPRESYWLNA